MTTVPSSARPGRTIRQERGRKSYEVFIATGFKLLEEQEFASITVADLGRQAGYSVGAFYARFHSKDEFLEAMVAQHLRERSDARRKLLEVASREEFIGAFIGDLVEWYWRRRGFWRAALMRSVQDPDFWEPIQQSAREFLEAILARIQRDAGRRLNTSETANVTFAVQMVLGMINNRIVNRPRPTLVGTDTFASDLTRAFRLITDYDNLIGNAA